MHPYIYSSKQTLGTLRSDPERSRRGQHTENQNKKGTVSTPGPPNKRHREHARTSNTKNKNRHSDTPGPLAEWIHAWTPGSVEAHLKGNWHQFRV